MTSPSPETPDQRKNLAGRAHAQAERQLQDHPRPNANEAERLNECVAIVATMSRAVRQTIAIEIRLDTPARTRPGYRLAPRLAPRLRDPRRILLTRIFHAAIAGDPEAAQRRREITAHIQHHLEADPDQLEPIAETLAALCNELDIDLDPARIPDELLDFVPPESGPDPGNHP